MSYFFVCFDDICLGMDWECFVFFERFFVVYLYIKFLFGVVLENCDFKLNV